MHRFRKILIFPTFVSVVLTTAFFFVSIRFAPVSTVDAVRDAFFFLLQVETLLLGIAVLLHFGATEPGSRMQALFADKRSVECLCKIECVIERCKRRDTFMLARLADALQTLYERISPIEQGHYVCTQSELMERTGDLYEAVEKTIRAVSGVDVRNYWKHPTIGPRAITLNAAACTRGIMVQRVFVLDNAGEITRDLEFFKRLQQLGVSLFYVYRCELSSALINVDFALYDSSYVQHFTIQAFPVRRDYRDCAISMNASRIAEYEKTYKLIQDLAKPLDPFNEKQWITLWATAEFRNFYSGHPPDLQLYRLTPSPLSVLDVGCGAGRTLDPFASIGCRMTGIDHDPIALAICRERVPDAILVEARFEAGSLEGQTFDVIVCYNTIYHNTQGKMFEALDHMFHILNPGGYLLLTVKTVDGNAAAIVKDSTQVELNTWCDLNFPDYWELHHFSDETEVSRICSPYELVHRTSIPLVEANGCIVQAAGYYLILRKPI